MKSSRKIISLCWVVIVLQLSACASMFNRGGDTVYVDTSPAANVEVVVHNPGRSTYSAQLPLTIYSTPSSFEDLSIELNDRCFKPGYTIVSKRVTDSYWLNFLNLHGFYIDYFSGYMWDYSSRITIPVYSLEEAGIDCHSQSSAAQQSVTQNTTVRKQPAGMYQSFTSRMNRSGGNNMIGFEWFLARSLNPHVSHDIGLGAGASYTRRLSSENMINLSIKTSRRDRCDSYSCIDYITEQESTLISFRRYLTPASNFYGGLGAARVSIKQTDDIYIFDKPISESTWSDEFTTLFLEMGWMARQGIFTYKFRGIIDFSDIGLNSPSLSNKSYLARDSSRADIRERELQYHAAARLTGFEFGFGLLF